MTRASSKGTCSFCKESFAKQAITRHLLACKAKPEDNDAVDVKKSAKGPAGGAVFHIMVEAKHWPVFWMHLEVPEQATLQDLDEFLRAIWLECCGHLRSFEIGGETFFSERMEPGDRSMRVRLGKVPLG
jgi:hypothetical protein